MPVVNQARGLHTGPGIRELHFLEEFSQELIEIAVDQLIALRKSLGEDLVNRRWKFKVYYDSESESLSTCGDKLVMTCRIKIQESRPVEVYVMLPHQIPNGERGLSRKERMLVLTTVPVLKKIDALRDQLVLYSTLRIRDLLPKWRRIIANAQ